MKRFVLFTDSYCPLSDATSIYNKQIVDKLSQSQTVTVVCPTFIGNLKNIFLRPNKNLYIRNIPLPFISSKIIILKFIRYVLYTFSTLVYLLLKKNSPSIYIIHTSPPTMIPVFTFLLFLRNFIYQDKKKLVLIAHDIYPDVLYISNKNRNYFFSFLFRFLDKLFSYSYNSFDLVIACSKSIKDKMVLKYNLKINKVKTIYNWSLISDELVSHDKFENINKREIYNYSNTNIFLIGNIGQVHMHKILCSRLENILNNRNNIHLHLLIRGSKSSYLKNMLSSNQKVSIHPLVPPEELLNFYTQRSITVLSLPKHVSEVAFPSRIATACSLSSPILYVTDKRPGNYVSDFIEKNNIGICITEGDDIQKLLFKFDYLLDNYSNFSLNSFNCYLSFFKMSKGLSLTTNALNSNI
tara:strand:+ start:9812 stop:11041 length:1230 start_codon:yes stop_codon:yes gene_type:complete